MSTMLSSRRFAGGEVRKETGAAGAVGEKSSGISLAVSALIGGAVVFLAGAHWEVDLLLAAGFMALATSGLYLNGLFWAHMEATGRFTPGKSRINW